MSYVTPAGWPAHWSRHVPCIAWPPPRSWWKRQPVTLKRDASGFLAQVFQALRIAVNDELACLSGCWRSARIITPAEGWW